MKKPYRIVLLWPFFIVSLAIHTACSTSNSDQKHYSLSALPVERNASGHRIDTSNWKIYRTDTLFIKYPPSWTVQDKNLLAKPMRFYIKSPRQSSGDRFLENLLVVEEPLKQTGTLDEFFRQNKKKIENVLGNGIISEQKVSDHVLPYYKLDYKVQMNNRPLRFRQHYYVWQRKGYIVTFTGLEQDWNKYVDTMQSILDSFKILPALTRH